MSSNQEKFQSSVVVVVVHVGAAAAAVVVHVVVVVVHVGAVVFLLPLLLILDTVFAANRFLKTSRICGPLSSLCVPLESGHYSAVPNCRMVL